MAKSIGETQETCVFICQGKLTRIVFILMGLMKASTDILNPCKGVPQASQGVVKEEREQPLFTAAFQKALWIFF